MPASAQSQAGLVSFSDMRLHSVLLFAKDLPRMSAFYGGSLGMIEVEGTSSDTYVEFHAGDARLALHAIPPEISSQFEVTSPPQPREDTPVKLIFAVDDLQAECERLRTLGVPFTLRPWGAADVIDPEGNIFQLSGRSAA